MLASVGRKIVRFIGVQDEIDKVRAIGFLCAWRFVTRNKNFRERLKRSKILRREELRRVLLPLVRILRRA